MLDVLGSAPLLISMTDVAELAGVHRPVVTNWRRRHPAFPAPVDDVGARPLFDARQVCEWLVSTGRAEREQIESDLCLHAFDVFTGTLQPRELVAVVTALICLRQLDDESLAGATIGELRQRADEADPGDDLLRSEVATLQTMDLPWLVDDLIEAAWGCQPAFDRILAARARLGSRELTSTALDPQLVRLVAGLSGVAELALVSSSLVLADPLAGAGDLLVGLIRGLPESCVPVVAAVEPDPYLARLLRRRLAVAGLPPEDRDVRSSASGAAHADAIATHLLYQPAETRSAAHTMDRIGRIAERLAPGRTAVVLGPADGLTGALSPFSVPERARAALLAGGRVEAVIRLPGGLVPFRPGYETAVWVLTSAHSSPARGRVLLGDVSGRPLTADVVDALVSDVVTWRRDGHRPDAHTRRFCVQSDVADLVGRPGGLMAPLLPSVRERGTKVPASVARVAELESTLAALAAERRLPIRSGVVQAQPVAPELVSVGTLVRSGQVQVVQGARIRGDEVIADGQYRVIGPAELAGGPVGRSIDRAVLADRYPRAQLTEPGDVVVTLSPAPLMAVDHLGLAVVEYPARVLRIPPGRRDRLRPRVLATLLHAGAAPRTSRAVRASRRLLDLEIPVLTADAAQHLDALLTRLDDRRALALRELAALDEIAGIIASGLADATLTFDR